MTIYPPDLLYYIIIYYDFVANWFSSIILWRSSPCFFDREIFQTFLTPALGREMIINREYNEGVYVMHRVSTLRVGLQHLQIRDHRQRARFRIYIQVRYEPIEWLTIWYRLFRVWISRYTLTSVPCSIAKIATLELKFNKTYRRWIIF